LPLFFITILAIFQALWLKRLVLSCFLTRSSQSVTVVTSRFLIMDLNYGDSSVSFLNFTDQVFSSQTPLQLTNF
jgi:hypothetical protein